LKRDIHKLASLGKSEKNINLMRFLTHYNLKELEFKNKTILILGGNSDVGKSLAKDFGELGSNLILTSRKKSQLDSFKSNLEIRYEINCNIEIFDALDLKSHESFYKKLNTKPDIVISCIGYLDNQEESQKDFNEALKSIQSNFTGLVSILNIISNDFERKGTGVIVGISSVAGDRGRGSNYIYGSSKSAFTTYLSGLRNRLYVSGVRVITIKPGFIKSKMTNHLKLPSTITSTPNKVSILIIKSIQKRKNVLYIKGYWKWIMITIKLIPENIFKSLKL
jgi:short-subunit dehydrogenase